MTLTEIKCADKEILTPADVAPVLGCDPHSIRVQAQTDASMLGFPVIVIGRRVKIPRRAFLLFLEEGKGWKTAE